MTASPTPAEFSLLTDIALGIVFAAAASHVARLLRQPLILGYVLGGVLLGSHLGFGLVTDERSIELISEIGLIFLLFIIGLEINLRELAKMGKAALAVGIMNANFALVALLAFFLFREQLQPSKLVGLAATLSGLWLMAR